MKRFSITLFVFATMLFTSCNDDYLENDNPNMTEQTKTIDKLNLSQTEKLRLDFGRAFAFHRQLAEWNEGQETSSRGLHQALHR